MFFDTEEFNEKVLPLNRLITLRDKLLISFVYSLSLVPTYARTAPSAQNMFSLLENMPA